MLDAITPTRVKIRLSSANLLSEPLEKAQPFNWAFLFRQRNVHPSHHPHSPRQISRITTRVSRITARDQEAMTHKQGNSTTSTLEPNSQQTQGCRRAVDKHAEVQTSTQCQSHASVSDARRESQTFRGNKWNQKLNQCHQLKQQGNEIHGHGSASSRSSSRSHQSRA